MGEPATPCAPAGKTSSALHALPSTSIDDTEAVSCAPGAIWPTAAWQRCLFLALKLGRPLFLEGEAGVGKTEIAKVLAETLGRRLLRLQCYEGLDVASAVYEWNYPRGRWWRSAWPRPPADGRPGRLARSIFTERFPHRTAAVCRPCVPTSAAPRCLLIDELDRTDEPFEAYLLELLSDFQVTIPELGKLAADEAPIVIITSNRTREIHDALKRRCFYHWVDYPTADREAEILRLRAPETPAQLSQQVVAFVQQLRRQDLFKAPGIAETLDWAEALVQLDKLALDPTAIDDTLGVLLKYQDDIAKIQGSEAARILEEVRRDATRIL